MLHRPWSPHSASDSRMCQSNKVPLRVRSSSTGHLMVCSPGASCFLLAPAKQALVIEKVARALEPNGRFLFTAPRRPLAWFDGMTGQRSESLGEKTYERVLHDVGLTWIGSAEDEGGNHYYLSRSGRSESQSDRQDKPHPYPTPARRSPSARASAAQRMRPMMDRTLPILAKIGRAYWLVCNSRNWLGNMPNRLVNSFARWA